MQVKTSDNKIKDVSEELLSDYLECIHNEACYQVTADEMARAFELLQTAYKALRADNIQYIHDLVDAIRLDCDYDGMIFPVTD